MCADRARYELQQAALLRALQGRDAILNGFETEDLAAASESLLRKRARAVADSWPALTHALGGEFLTEFERFARATPPPREGEGIADGFLFATSLDPNVLAEDARVEILLARGVFKLRPDGCQPRHGLFLSTALLNEPRRLLIVIHLPRLGRRHVAVHIGMGRAS